jgi:hypothetical protein
MNYRGKCPRIISLVAVNNQSIEQKYWTTFEVKPRSRTFSNFRTVTVSKSKLNSLTCGIKKHDIYWSGSQWYCRNCNQHEDKSYMTKETRCKGEGKGKGQLLNSLLNYTME